MKPREILSLDVKVSLGVFVVVFVVYLLTLCPTIYPGPSADAVCDVKGVGLTPPSMHPIWIILGHFFAIFSSNTAYLLNLMSALFGALTIALLYALLAQFGHLRTAEEEARYQIHPHLRQLVAISASLLVAFSYPFWEGSVLAGSDTLNTFFLVVILLLVTRYSKTSKSRYAIVLGLIYGLAITNYPTLLLFAPLFAIFFLTRGRIFLDDPVAVVAAIILFGVGLLPALTLPNAYVLGGKDYVIHATTFGQATSVFFNSYFRALKTLFSPRAALHDWLFWLFLPAFVPIAFFTMKRGEYERGSIVATRLTYVARYLFVLVFTIGGLCYLWGYLIGPVGMADLDFVRDSRYLGSYVLVGAWLSYVLGYWIIVLTGKFKPTGIDPEPKIKYRKVPYIVSAVVILALPVVGIVMNYQKSSKRHAAFVEDFVNGLLKSCPDRSIVVVPAEPYFGSMGPPLRYFLSQKAASSDQAMTIVDLNAVYLDFYREKRIDTARYLAETVLGRTVLEPRRLFLPEQPFFKVYDGILRCETLRSLEDREQPRPVYGLVNNFFSSPLLAGNDLMNEDYRIEPSALFYVYRSRAQHSDTSAVIESNEKRWHAMEQARKPSPLNSAPSQVEEHILADYSRSANDFGVFCQFASQWDLAEKYYRKALSFCPENSSALLNLAFILGRKNKSEEATALLEKRERLIGKQKEKVRDLLQTFGMALDSAALLQEERRAAQEGPDAEARRLAILYLGARIVPDSAYFREQAGNILFSAASALAKRPRTEEVAALEQARFQEARGEFYAALERTDPRDQKSLSRIWAKLARVYDAMGIRSEAETFYKKASHPDDPSSQVELMEFYIANNENPTAIKQLATDVLNLAPRDEEETKTLAPLKSRAAILMARVALNSGDTKQAKTFLTNYLTRQPEQAHILLTLANRVLPDPNLTAFATWLFEQYIALQKSLPAHQLSAFADVLLRQKRYEDVIALKEPAAGPEIEVAKFYRFKAIAYEQLDRNQEAEAAYRRARSALPYERGYFAISLINDLAWRCFKNGKLAEAEKLAREALIKDPADSFVWDTYGWILYKSGKDLDEALRLVERSHLANPDTGIIAYHYGKLLIEKGLRAKGISVLHRAVEVGIKEKEELNDAEEILKGHATEKGNAGTEPS